MRSDIGPVRAQGGLRWLGDHPVGGSILITILAGLALQLTHMIDFQEIVQSVVDEEVTVRLADVGFRMAMGALVVFVLVPRLFGHRHGKGWLRQYLAPMRVSLGASARKTASVAMLSLSALVLILAGFSLGLGVYHPDLGVLVTDNQWIILLLALVPGVWEELIFRGIILSNLERRFSPRAGLVGSSVLFGLFHFGNLGVWDDLASVVAGVILATIFGLAWGYAVLRTNSILPAMLLHYSIDVLLEAELFIDPSATDDEFSIIVLGIAVLWPALTVLATRVVCGRRPG